MPKRTKSIKVTNQKANKPWNRGKNIKYKVSTRKINPKILIVCEGQTEKLYFDSFPVLSLTVEIENLEGQSKLKLVEKAKILKTKEKYEEIWCVFDMDVCAGQKECSDFDNAIYKASQYGFKIAYSNDSFELWFCLHYQYIDNSFRRNIYFELLTNKWGFNYDKEGKNEENCRLNYHRLESDTRASLELALKFAEKLHKEKQHLPYHKQNPVTTVYLLVNFLLENCKY